jgi:hypothetical protein
MLSSNAFEQTDYSQYAALSKKKVDVDNIVPVVVERPKTAATGPKPTYSQKT